jgi:ADP-ribose pyrophosphatase YjhB (NUDIX family)
MRKNVFEGKYLTASTENVDGHIYERVSMLSGVRVIPVEDDKILFIREYRKHEKQSRLKLIGGWVDKEEKNSEEIAKEELREEVSMSAKKWELFYTYNTPNQTIEERVDYFVAKELTKLSKQYNPDGDVVEDVVFLTQKQVKEKLINREILWDKDMVVVLLLFDQINK